MIKSAISDMQSVKKRMISDIWCVTNRTLCRENFLDRVEKLAAAHPAGIILREKDMNEEEYSVLAETVLKICKKYNTVCVIHSFTETAKKLNCKAFHVPLPVLRKMSDMDKKRFVILGASCHSLEDALEAERLGCTYITAGHIFNTDCKKGMPGRGFKFLQNICESVSIPVYAIGGIDEKNIEEIRTAKAAGACIMSSAMVCENPKEYLKCFH